MLAIAGDSASGKKTVAAGLVEALGPERCVALSVDDYLRFDRSERRDRPFTQLHPDCNYFRILEQHLQLLATDQPVLKPVYDHSVGRRVRPELVEPREFVVVHGLLPLHSKLARACFDVSVFLDPPENVRQGWKMQRDTTSRGYTAEQVLAELHHAETDSTRYVRPQRSHADIVVRFGAVNGNDDPDTPLSAELLLRPTIRQPDLTRVLPAAVTKTIHFRLARDNGRPVDSLHVHGYASTEENLAAETTVWEALGDPTTPIPDSFGGVSPGKRSTPLAITQMILLHHLIGSLQ